MPRVKRVVIVEQDGRRESGTRAGGGPCRADGLPWTPPDLEAKFRAGFAHSGLREPRRARACPSGDDGCGCLAPAARYLCCTRPLATGWEGDFNRQGIKRVCRPHGQRIAAKRRDGAG